MSFGQRNNLFSCHTHTHTDVLYIFFLHLSSYECKCAMRPSDRERCAVSIDVVHRQQMCLLPTSLPHCLPSLPYLPPTLKLLCSSLLPAVTQIRHDCSQTRFELSRVKSLLKLRDICRALSRICWQSYIVYTTLYSVHKSYANSLAEGAEGEEMQRYSSVTLFVLIGVKLQSKARGKERSRGRERGREGVCLGHSCATSSQ